MNAKSIWVAALVGLLGFVAGFMFANTLNRREQTPAAVSDDRSPSPQTPSSTSNSLSPEEIRAKIKSADDNPTDFAFQKNLGLSLYRYSSLKQDATILPDVIRIMQRALDLDPADRDLQIGLGNAHFDVGYFKKANQSFETARSFYKKALDRVPGDVDVRTDVALTYFLQEPPDLNAAVAEFEKGLAIDPKNERSLQFLVQTYVKQNEVVKASQTLDRLKAANPSNSAIPELQTLIVGGSPATPK